MSRILITGGKGFIGTNLTSELQSRGHSVHTLDLSHSEDSDHTRVDIRQFRQLQNLFETNNFEYVYHLAAEYGRWNGEDYFESLWATNVIGTKNILRLQEKFGFKQIFFSSCEVYGDYEGLMSEDVMDKIPIKQLNDYAISKWAGELQVLNSALMHGTQTVRVRPLNCYGPHEHYSTYRGVIPIMVYRALHNLPFTVYEGHTRIFDYVEDSVRTLANIVDNFLPGEVYNIGSNEDWKVSITDLSNLVLEITESSSSLVTYSGTESHTTRSKVVDLSKSRRDLNHVAKVDLREGLIRYVEWMRKIYASSIDKSRIIEA
jgi:dTDP-glucose 4,6-dehydratase